MYISEINCVFAIAKMKAEDNMRYRVAIEIRLQKI